LRAGPLKEYFRNVGVRRKIVAFATHQEEIGHFGPPSKRARNNMAALKRYLVPAIQNITPAGMRPLEIVFSAIMKATRPTSWPIPMDTDAEPPKATFPILKYLAL
jgi:hypothetical protein